MLLTTLKPNLKSIIILSEVGGINSNNGVGTVKRDDFHSVRPIYLLQKLIMCIFAVK